MDKPLHKRRGPPLLHGAARRDGRHFGRECRGTRDVSRHSQGIGRGKGLRERLVEPRILPTQHPPNRARSGYTNKASPNSRSSLDKDECAQAAHLFKDHCENEEPRRQPFPARAQVHDRIVRPLTWPTHVPRLPSGFGDGGHFRPFNGLPYRPPSRTCDSCVEPSEYRKVLPFCKNLNVMRPLLEAASLRTSFSTSRMCSVLHG
jgi:hypothetical protein